ncbi:MAG: T9SS type A sorting domain-containing protein, partial [Saprospiraceae bacterium]|nr:T9SS type A sorting domain-containing protein [Saprospiraceae bacterium]
ACQTIVQVAETIGTAETATTPHLRLSPNPATEQLLLSISGLPELAGARILVSDTQGRLLLSQPLAVQAPGQASLDVATLPAGVYFLFLLDEGGTRARTRFCKL